MATNNLIEACVRQTHHWEISLVVVIDIKQATIRNDTLTLTIINAPMPHPKCANNK